MMSSVRSSMRAAVLRAAHLGGVAKAARAFDRLRGGIRVMNLHGTPASSARAFREQVRWVAERFALISPQEFFAVARGECAAPARPAVLFTFDDGLRSNADVAAPVLEEFGTRGLFFVCPGFSELRDEDAKRFFYSRVEPQTPPSADADDWSPLRAEDVAAMHRAGHVIGNHTWSHARLSEVGAADLPGQIEQAATRIEAWTGARCEAFAWTFAWNAISPAAHAAVRARHPFVFAACPGTTTARTLQPSLIFRTHVEAGWSADEYAFFYSGLADPLWARRRRALRRLLGAA